MTIQKLSLIIAVIAGLLLILFRNAKWIKSHWMSFLQLFCGFLFLFSGFVKIVDVTGTAYKMEQYFAEFESTFRGAGMEGLSGIFPYFAAHSNFFSNTMITLELMVGVFLVFGLFPRLTSWLFFGIMLFFTVLTGYTYLTGYVQEGGNFFKFSTWGMYQEKNMKVTDCGCFGDFMKLKPVVTFTKDVILMIPAILFLFYYRKFHELWWNRLHKPIFSIGLTAMLFFFGYYFSNRQLPGIDFLPFKKGIHIKNQKLAEQKAESDVKFIAFLLKNKNSGKVTRVEYADYMKNFSKYPKDQWETIDQIKTETAIPITKISSFELYDKDGNSVTDSILDMKGGVIWLLIYKYEFTRNEKEFNYVSRQVTTQIDSLGPLRDTLITYTDTLPIYHWNPDFKNRFTSIVKFIKDAQKVNMPVILLSKYDDNQMIQAFLRDMQLDIPYVTADDIVLKTMIRSNPGIFLMDKGIIKDKYHYLHIPGISSTN